jgi:hypothetical protein
MKKVLLVDTNFSAAPIHDHMVQAGNAVFVCGCNPHDYLAKSSKNYINIDYSNLDQMRDLIQSLAIDHIVPGCNDRSYQVCAALSTCGPFSGLDSCETTEIINNKEKFRAFAAQIGLPVPRVIPVEQIGDIWPLIVKPVDAYSGRGMTIIQESEASSLQAAIQQAESFSKTKTCIIEELVSGQLYSHSAFLKNGSIEIDFVVEEHGTANPFVVDTSRVINDFPPDMLQCIRSCVLQIARYLNLIDGLIHTQFIAHGNSFWLIEITRRCPGDLYSQLIESSTGFRYAEAFSKPFLNQQVNKYNQRLQKSYVLRHTISQPNDKIFDSLQFNVPLQIEKFVALSLSGDQVKGSPFGRIGLLFIKAFSENDLSMLLERTLDRDLYTIH